MKHCIQFTRKTQLSFLHLFYLLLRISVFGSFLFLLMTTFVIDEQSETINHIHLNFYHNLKKEKLVGHWLIFSQNLIFSFAFLDKQMCILVFTWWWFSNLIRQRKLMSTPLHRLIHPGVNWIKQTMASGNDGDVEKRNLPKKIVNISFWEDITRKRVSFHSQPMPQPKLMALF